MRDIIKTKKIQKQFIINFDETPFYWEHLPRKAICRKIVKTCRGYKKGYYRARSTVGLAVSANGDVLRPLLILKRKLPYYLRTENKINIMVSNSKNGWINEDIVIKWLLNVLLPYVQNNICLLLWDSFEAHISSTVLSFLKNHPNIIVGTIVGRTTDFAQPLDLGINKKFKDACKKKALSYTNTTLETMEIINYQQLSKPQKHF